MTFCKKIKHIIIMTTLSTLGATSCCHTEPVCPQTGSCPPEDKAAITKAINCYIEAGRQGNSAIARQAFTPTATMSWFENGK